MFVIDKWQLVGLIAVGLYTGYQLGCYFTAGRFKFILRKAGLEEQFKAAARRMAKGEKL